MLPTPSRVRVLLASTSLAVAATMLSAVPAQAGDGGGALTVTAERSGARAAGKARRTKGPEKGPLIAGETSYVEGAHVWTDYAYDDRGADSDDVPGGDAAYPEAPHPGNTADLVQLQLDTDKRGRLRVRAVLGSLMPGHDAMVGVAFNTDGDRGTGVPTPDMLEWLPDGFLGLDLMVLLGSDGKGRVLRGDANGWRQVGTAPVRVDRSRNLVSARFGVVRPGRTTWEAVGVSGRLEDGRSWFDTDLPIQDLAYVRGEDPPNQVLLSVPASLPPEALQPFGDHIQADVLAGELSAELAVADVRFGTTRTSLARPRPGYNAFLYHSRVGGPEGIARDPRIFRGVYQPHAVWIPAGLPKRPPMVVFLHGADQYHTVNVAYFSNPDSIGIPSPYDVPAITIFPNGRTTNWGTPLADRDALDAIDDAVRRLGIDQRRIVLSGVSSGGYGTYHLASRYPDRFTGAYSLVGGTGLGRGAVAAVENLTNVPFRASNGLADPLVNANVWRTSADALEAAKTVDYRIVLVHNRSHDGPLAEGNCYLRDLLSRNVVRRPGRVRFRVPVLDREAVRLGLRPTRAYWLNDLRARDASAGSYVDATSGARRQQVVAEDAIRRVDENATHGADFCGPNPAMQNGNNWSIEGRSFRPAAAAPSRRLTLTLENLSRARVDLRRAGLGGDRKIRVVVVSDGPAKLRLGDQVVRVGSGRTSFVHRP